MTTIRRINQAGMEAGRLAIGDLIETLLTILYVCTMPITPKTIFSCIPQEYDRRSVYKCIRRLYAKGKIHKLEGKENWFKINAPMTSVNDIVSLKQNKYSKSWDGQWRMLIYDIVEKKKTQREKFREYIKSLGFAKVQDSCWVCPYDYADEISQCARRLNILNSICLYKGTFYAGKNIDVLVEEVWGLQSLVNEYEVCISECDQLCDLANTIESRKDLMQKYSILCSMYRDILSRDPFLPDAFFKQQCRIRAEKSFQRLLHVLAKRIVM